MKEQAYVGRFAPSPTGALHAGSLVAALASWLDARAHGGRWLVRMEDTDAPRCVPGADREILRQLAALGLQADEPPLWQSQREAVYQQALDDLASRNLAYPCACTRRDIEAALAAQGHEHRRHEERVYPGTCRDGLRGKPARAWRLRCGTDAAPVRIAWDDRRLGAQSQDVTHEVGDFVLQRADGIWSYQLAVVVDDALQGVTHVVRGEDLTDNTARQIWLQQQIHAPRPVYLHLPLVLDARGEKLSKQHGAPAVDVADPLAALRAAAQALQLPVEEAGDVDGWLQRAVRAWACRWANGNSRER
ncbi:tRNA glutamyl-Q(34) synthetase GluQRS [Azohydromonas lata]|uniref:tRNA glutamyl-Q(34) synthetase GluQRS n=1 Tax=Azohydromonas lata TaxID=45677 RepID=UPI0008333367|nr:tRNA glutamyl-Q(34) synthetase GluQRS [Azohydromonas lata]